MKAFEFSNYHNFKIFFTFFLLWLSVQFEVYIEDTIAFVLIITLGIIHGANDLLILSVNHSSKDILRKDVFIYLGIIGICIGLYFINAFISMIAFILISSYHFGEEHFSSRIKLSFIFNTFYYTFYGLLVFALLFFHSLDGVNDVMMQLTGVTFNARQIELSIYLSSGALLMLNAYLFYRKKETYVGLGKEIFYLLLLFLVFKSTSLVLGFAIYFIFWHSLPSIIHQILYISGDISKKSAIDYVKKAMLNWIISIAGLLATYYFFPQIETFASVIFIILFAVTAPHMWVMYKMKTSA